MVTVSQLEKSPWWSLSRSVSLGISPHLAGQTAEALGIKLAKDLLEDANSRVAAQVQPVNKDVEKRLEVFSATRKDAEGRTRSAANSTFDLPGLLPRINDVLLSGRLSDDVIARLARRWANLAIAQLSESARDGNPLLLPVAYAQFVQHESALVRGLEDLATQSSDRAKELLKTLEAAAKAHEAHFRRLHDIQAQPSSKFKRQFGFGVILLILCCLVAKIMGDWRGAVWVLVLASLLAVVRPRAIPPKAEPDSLVARESRRLWGNQVDHTLEFVEARHISVAATMAADVVRQELTLVQNSAAAKTALARHMELQRFLANGQQNALPVDEPFIGRLEIGGPSIAARFADSIDTQSMVAEIISRGVDNDEKTLSMCLTEFAAGRTPRIDLQFVLQNMSADPEGIQLLTQLIADLAALGRSVVRLRSGYICDHSLTTFRLVVLLPTGQWDALRAAITTAVHPVLFGEGPTSAITVVATVCNLPSEDLQMHALALADERSRPRSQGEDLLGPFIRLDAPSGAIEPAPVPSSERQLVLAPCLEPHVIVQSGFTLPPGNGHTSVEKVRAILMMARKDGIG